MVISDVSQVLDFYPRPPRGGRLQRARQRPARFFISIHALREEGDLLDRWEEYSLETFLSTPSARRATRLTGASPSSDMDFYPRPPRGGRPSTITAMRTAVKFLSTPSARRATPDSAGDHPDQRFLSTPSARRATRSRGSLQRFRIFLSTPSARRATSQAYFSFRRCIISIHALREEGDVTDLGQIKLPYRISIHALREEGDLSIRPLPRMTANFYPRPPRGGRPQGICMAPFLTGFLSTPSARRATRYNRWTKRLHNHFYPRPPRGGRRDRHSKFKSITRFLSTPSARRATSAEAAANRAWQISIHALREEGDNSFQCSQSSRLDFYPRPPRGGRPSLAFSLLCNREISIHALREEGDGCSIDLGHIVDVFLSTPSARRATGESCHRGCRRDISIHALCEEGDA